MLPLLLRVHHLKLSQQGRFGTADTSLRSRPLLILSGVAASQSEAATQSKYSLYPATAGPLLHFDSSAGIRELLLDGLRLVLVDALFNGLGSAIHEVLGLLQPQTGHFADGLDYIDLIRSDRGQNDGKLGLFLGRYCARRSSAARHHHWGRCRR